MTREELIDLYCQDWKETPVPWERWQWRPWCLLPGDKSKWFDLDHHPFLELGAGLHEYRRKPERIRGWFAQFSRRMRGPYTTKQEAQDDNKPKASVFGAATYIYIDTEMLYDDQD
jgi:hypothetical protein